MLGVPVSTTQRWLRRLRSDGDMASRNIGDRVVRRLVCASCFPHMFRLTSLSVSSVSRLWVHGCNEERVRAAALINAWISVDPCCTVASVRKRLQASGIGSARRRVCGKHLARHAFLAVSVVIVLFVPSRASNDLFYAVSFGFSQ